MEMWEKIEGLNYEVSTYGRVRNMFTGKYLTLQDNKGYSKVEIRQDGKRYRFRVHRLVAEAFILNPNNKPQVNHIDGNKLNNHYMNLEWCTQQENNRHAIDTQLINGINREDVIKIYLDSWVNQIKVSDIARKYKTSEKTVKSIMYKESYKDILKKINLEIKFSLV